MVCRLSDLIPMPQKRWPWWPPQRWWQPETVSVCWWLKSPYDKPMSSSYPCLIMFFWGSPFNTIDPIALVVSCCIPWNPFKDNLSIPMALWIVTWLTWRISYGCGQRAPGADCEELQRDFDSDVPQHLRRCGSNAPAVFGDTGDTRDTPKSQQMVKSIVCCCMLLLGLVDCPKGLSLIFWGQLCVGPWEFQLSLDHDDLLFYWYLMAQVHGPLLCGIYQ